MTKGTSGSLTLCRPSNCSAQVIHTWCPSLLPCWPQTLLRPSSSCVISHCCQYQDLILPFEAFSVSLTIAKFKIQGLAVKAPMILTLVSFSLLLPSTKTIPLCYSSVLTSHHYYSKFFVLKKFPDFVYCDFSEEFINFRLPPHLQASVTVSLPAQERNRSPRRQTNFVLLIKALFYSESVFVQIYSQVYLIERI